MSNSIIIHCHSADANCDIREQQPTGNNSLMATRVRVLYSSFRSKSNLNTYTSLNRLGLTKSS